MRFVRILPLVVSGVIITTSAFAENSATNGAWDKTKDVTGDVWGGTKNVASDVWDGTKKVTSDVWNGTKQVGSDIKEGVLGEDEPAEKTNKDSSDM